MNKVQRSSFLCPVPQDLVDSLVWSLLVITKHIIIVLSFPFFCSNVRDVYDRKLACRMNERLKAIHFKRNRQTRKERGKEAKKVRTLQLKKIFLVSFDTRAQSVSHKYRWTGIVRCQILSTPSYDRIRRWGLECPLFLVELALIADTFEPCSDLKSSPA